MILVVKITYTRYVTNYQIEWLENKFSDVMVEFHEIIALKPTWSEVIEQEQIKLTMSKIWGDKNYR